jgi:phosphoglycerate dehydrogenase-like enzyme
MMKFIHIANRRPHGGLFPQIFLDALSELGELRIVEQGADLSEEEKLSLLQEADVAIVGWNCAALPSKLAKEPGQLGYVCNLTGTMSGFVPEEIVASSIYVSNWGDSPSFAIAEGAMALLLSTLKDIHAQVMSLREGNWGLNGKEFGGTLYQADVGVYGCGVIGRRFIELLKPFGSEITVFDPYCDEIPEGCKRVNSLKELFEGRQVISICAGLSEETEKSITAELLALLPDRGVIVNTARGEIIDQDALFSELESGRLRAGLDVVVPDGVLPKDHPVRKWKNCVISCHDINRGWPSTGEPPKRLGRMHQICVENLKAYAAGEPINFQMDLERYLRST